jgi:hypothetical protein
MSTDFRTGNAQCRSDIAWASAVGTRPTLLIQDPTLNASGIRSGSSVTRSLQMPFTAAPDFPLKTDKADQRERLHERCVAFADCLGRYHRKGQRATTCPNVVRCPPLAAERLTVVPSGHQRICKSASKGGECTIPP